MVEWWLNGDFDGNLLEMVIYDWFMDDLWMIYRFANLEMVIYDWFMDDLLIEHGDL